MHSTVILHVEIDSKFYSTARTHSTVLSTVVCWYYLIHILIRLYATSMLHAAKWSNQTGNECLDGMSAELAPFAREFVEIRI